MREKYRNPIASIKKFPQFTIMNVIDGQAGLIICASLIFYSLTTDNILNIIVLLLLAGISIQMLSGDNGILQRAGQAKEATRGGEVKETVTLEIINNNNMSYIGGTQKTRTQVINELYEKGKLTSDEVSYLEENDLITIGGITTDFSYFNNDEELNVAYEIHGKIILINVDYTENQLEKIIGEQAEIALNSNSEIIGDEEDIEFLEKIRYLPINEETKSELKGEAQENEITYKEFLADLLGFFFNFDLSEMELKVMLNGDYINESQIDGNVITALESGTYNIEITTFDGKKKRISVLMNDVEKIVTIFNHYNACIDFIPKENQTWYEAACDNSIAALDTNLNIRRSGEQTESLRSIITNCYNSGGNESAIHITLSNEIEYGLEHIIHKIASINNNLKIAKMQIIYSSLKNSRNEIQNCNSIIVPGETYYWSEDN
ncbi:MAG: hypothetical protein IKF17_00015 [Clostridia bacterium]|nr:hypothetical protein [Clostridia bacterium]